MWLSANRGEVTVKISSFGLFWRRSEIDWWPGLGQRGRFKLLGRIGVNRGKIRIADFRTQQGIYVLFDEHGPSYVGLARREKGLGQRLKEHTCDHLENGWDRFCWFGFKPLAASTQLKGFYGLGAPEAEVEEDSKTTIGDLEALLIQVMGPKLNTQKMKFSGAEKWDQIGVDDVDRYLQKLKPGLSL